MKFRRHSLLVSACVFLVLLSFLASFHILDPVKATANVLGFDVKGGTGDYISSAPDATDYIIGTRFLCSGTCTIKNITAFVYQHYLVARNVVMGIYSDSPAGKVGSLLNQTTAASVAAAYNNWLTQGFAANWTLTTGTYYWFVISGGPYTGTSRYIYGYRDASDYASQSMFYALTYSDTLPASFTPTAYTNYKFSIFVNYTSQIGVSDTLTLGSPSSGATNYTGASINFTYTPSFSEAINDSTLQIYSGTSLYATCPNASAVLNNTVNGISYTFGAAGTYSWNMRVSSSTTGYFATSNNTLTIYAAPGEFQYTTGTSNVDGVADVGTHSSFASEQSAPDGVFDNMTSGVSSAEVNVTCNNNQSNGWINAPNVWDGSTATYAYYSISSYGYTPYLVLNLSSTALGSHIAFWVNSGDAGDTMTIDVANQTGSWVNAFPSAAPTKGHYVNATFTAAQYTAMRYRFYSSTSASCYIYETNAFNDTVYSLSLEEQWTAANYTMANRDLCIFMGNFSSKSVQPSVQYWTNSTWTTIISVLAPNTWNIISVTSYFTWMNFTIRFYYSGLTRSSWLKDSALIHAYSGNYQTPTIQDFWVNQTWANQSNLFSFNLVDSIGIGAVTFSTNRTGSMVNESQVFTAVSSQAYEYYNTGYDGNDKIYGQSWEAQTFYVGANHNVTSINLRMYRVGVPEYLNVSIRATSSGKPTGNDLTGALINASTFTTATAGAWYSVTIPEYNLSSSTLYAIVVRATNGTASKYVQWRTDTTSPTYSAGNDTYCNDNGTTWATRTTYDNMFEVWGPGNSTTTCWANFTETMPSSASVLAFQFWAWNTVLNYSTTGIRYVKIYVYNSTGGAWNTPFNDLATAISTIELANDWTKTDVYLGYCLDQNTTLDVTNKIDGYANSGDWVDVLKWCAIINKLNITWANKASDLTYALGNYTMVGSLPYTQQDGTANTFSPENKWALFGYYFAVVYSANLTKWNITAAYQQFNVAVSYSVNTGYGGYLGLPLYLYANNTGRTTSDRYYDEDACTIDCYVVFYSLLNVSTALNDGLTYWTYLNQYHWNPDVKGNSYQYYRYARYFATSNTFAFECEASFFLKIISILKYYSPNLPNYTRLLQDIGTRFLSSEWNSYQWLDYTTNASTYVVTHMYTDNQQRRLDNTLGAWQALLGAYLQLNSTYQTNLKDMLYGNQNSEPAWSLLLSPSAALFGNSTNKFYAYGDHFGVPAGAPDENATAKAEILLFMMGIVPGTATIAFPLEELGYEYIYDIDPVLLQFSLNQTTRVIKVPVVQAGTITFQYGVSPITCSFGQAGVYSVRFSNSWNLITNVTLLSSLPSNVIYFYLYVPPAYSALGWTANLIGSSSTAYVDWYSSGGNSLYGFFFGCNITGTFVNETFSIDVALFWGGTFEEAWGNVTKTLPSSHTVIQWREWANDTSGGGWGDTGLQNFTVIQQFYVNESWPSAQTWIPMVKGVFHIYAVGWISSGSYGTVLNGTFKLTPSFSTLETYTQTSKDTYHITPSFSLDELYSELISAKLTISMTTQWSTEYQYTMNVSANFHTTVIMNSGQGFIAIIKTTFVPGIGYIFASFTWLPSMPNTGQLVLFSSTSSSSQPITTSTWDFGDGNVTAGAGTISHAYSASGLQIFLCNLTVTNAVGDASFVAPVVVGASNGTGGGSIIFQPFEISLPDNIQTVWWDRNWSIPITVTNNMNMPLLANFKYAVQNKLKETVAVGNVLVNASKNGGRFTFEIVLPSNGTAGGNYVVSLNSPYLLQTRNYAVGFSPMMLFGSVNECLILLFVIVAIVIILIASSSRKKEANK